MQMWLFLSITIVSIISILGDDDICSRDFSGVTDPLSMEYGFCSSCVSNGFRWCTLTSHCQDPLNSCGVNNIYSLSSLEECHAVYENVNGENADVANTGYSPNIAEAMAVYTDYAYNEKSGYEKFTLDPATLRKFEDTVDSFTSNLECWFSESGIYEPDDSVKKELSDMLDPLFAKAKRKSKEAKEGDDDHDYGTHRAIVGVDNVNKGITISFRGTATAPTWISFTNMCLIEWAAAVKEDISVLKAVYAMNAGNVKISEAYSIAYDYLKKNSGFFEYVLELIDTERYRDYNVYITGHSLGGNLANILALDLYAYFYSSNSEFDINKIYIYTFGQSRVGNAAFAELVNNVYPSQYYRVVHSNDPFPSIPLWGPPFNYRHCGVEIHYGAGDYREGIMCQYRECIYMSPFEDLSCRARYNSIFINYELPAFDALHLDNYVSAVWHNTINIMDDILDLSKEYTSEYGWGDHNWYDEMGKFGHCGTHSHSEQNVVKCNEPLNDTDMQLILNRDNYRCLDSYQCHTDYNEESECCYGSPRGPRRICVDDVDGDGVCPLNELGAYCMYDSECKEWELKSVKCAMGLCTDVGRKENEECTTFDVIFNSKSEKCSSFANNGKLNCCFGKGLANKVVTTCQEIGNQECNLSQLGGSCRFDYNCLDWVPDGEVKCHHNICDESRSQSQSPNKLTSSLLFVALIMVMVLVLFVLSIRNIFSYDKIIKYQVVSLASSDDQC